MEFDHIEGILSASQNSRFFGHAAVTGLLRQMCAEGRLHHALLFEGLQGIGKATLAFHLAWNMLTETGRNFMHPDISSPAWRRIGQGAHPGLLHISRGYDIKTQKFRTAITIEDIRRIARFLQQTAADNGWRIVIVDPADDMNRNAANALLKTLEEPPAKTLFILISHNPGRVLPTIRSRCQPLTFKPLADSDLRQALSLIAAPADFNAEDPQTAELIRRSEGSVRQAVMILASGGLEIAHAVDDIMASPDFSVASAHRLAAALSRRDAAVQFDFFLDYLTHFLGERARKTALAGQAAEAGRISLFWQKIQQENTAAFAYNLDKKQHAIVLLQKIHGFVHDAP